MTGHIDESRMNDYVDGILSSGDSQAVEAHIGRCSECATYLAELVALVEDMGSLPTEAEPARDLWSGIHARIDGKDADVLELRTHTGVSTNRRVSMSWGQLLAASIVLASVSGGVVWATLNTPSNSISADAFISPIPAVQVATARYDEAILELEQVISRGQDVLAPETLQALQQSMRSINEAIEDATRALRQDPNSDLLNRLLSNHQQAKLRVLQRTLAAMQI